MKVLIVKATSPMRRLLVKIPTDSITSMSELDLAVREKIQEYLGVSEEISDQFTVVLFSYGEEDYDPTKACSEAKE